MYFFMFYFYCINRNVEKAFNCVKGNRRYYEVVLFPVGLMIIHFIIGIILSNMAIIYALFLHVPTTVGNLAFVFSVENKHLRFRRERNKKVYEYRYTFHTNYNRRNSNRTNKKSYQDQDDPFNFREKRGSNGEKKEKGNFHYTNRKLSSLHRAFIDLGVDESWSEEDIKKQFRRLSKKYHPDMHFGDQNKFIKIKKAYDNLNDYFKNNYRGNI